MNRRAIILEQLRAELGFAPDLVGGAKTILAQIGRFLVANDVPDDFDLRGHPILWNRLIAEVIVPETSFFRYPESFAALGRWIAERGPRPARCLCLPCSTGEEAWSIAMTFSDAAHADVNIDAVDASARSIGHAREGRYAERSVRGLPSMQLRRWFAALDGELAIVPELHRLVNFCPANAFSFHADPRSYDVIFCRNLLIYFDAENQRRLFERLERWLHPEGVLFLGPGEATVAASHGWKGTGRPMSFSFVRGKIQTSRPSKRTRPLPARSRSLPPPAPHPQRASRESPAVETDWLQRATTLANSGQLPGARKALEKFHADHPASSASLFLRGLLEEAGGERARAEADYRRTLYLEPHHVDALLHLSLLLESDGRAGTAAPFRRRLDRLAAAS